MRSEETECEFAKDRLVIVFLLSMLLKVREPGLNLSPFNFIEFFEALNDFFVICQNVWRKVLVGIDSCFPSLTCRSDEVYLMVSFNQKEEYLCKDYQSRL